MQKKVDGEKVTLIIVYVVIILAVAFILFAIFSSNKYFSSNEGENAQNKIEQEANEIEKKAEHDKSAENNTNNIVSEEEKKQVNVDDEIIKQQEQAQKAEQEKQENEKKAAEAAKPKDKEIAAFTSNIYDKDENRVFNITKAIDKLNGTIIANGEQFSFNGTIGPMGESAGYKKALGFDNKGNKIETYGGGMCQISSTLYNAALMANLQITERHPHSRRVYYVPKNKDATVYYGSLDLKFINNTGASIRIDASNTKTGVTIKLIQLG